MESRQVTLKDVFNYFQNLIGFEIKDDYVSCLVDPGQYFGDFQLCIKWSQDLDIYNPWYAKDILSKSIIKINDSSILNKLITYEDENYDFIVYFIDSNNNKTIYIKWKDENNKELISQYDENNTIHDAYMGIHVYNLLKRSLYTYWDELSENPPVTAG